MWEGQRVTDLTRLLGDPGIMARRAANFLLATGVLSQFNHANEPSIEDILYSREHTGTERGLRFQTHELGTMQNPRRNVQGTGTNVGTGTRRRAQEVVRQGEIMGG